ncbi:hypothetical protein FJT64_011018 [Amphibalanus amphitrite]|uniref:Endonuclease/exonuclease/phosphatase domain-containing protein n=1 Tax=Amphibalanus amphitrite TaxID=1232801 RepID=A0A6A4VAH1_AMPAM|nr:hypothetical protein FJT64_011018 [Amphibalanus amphitrite]
MCETWLKPSTPNRLIPVPGYQLLRRDRADGRGYGGVAVLVKEAIAAVVLDGPDQVTAGSKLESLWVQVGAGPQKVVICSLYRPPVQTQARVTADLDELERQLQHNVTRHSGPIIIAGDININTRDTSSSTATRLQELFAAYTIQQHIKDATFRSSGSTIDVIATNRGVERAGTAALPLQSPQLDSCSGTGPRPPPGPVCGDRAVLAQTGHGGGEPPPQ